MNQSVMNTSSKNKLSLWYSGLNQSEQRLLSIGSVLVALALFWVLVYKPVINHIDNQVAVKVRLQNQLAQMQELTGKANMDQSLTVIPMPTGVTFSSWVDQQLRAINLQEMVNRTEPIDQNTMSIWFQGAPFDQVIDWLQSISNQYAVQVDQIDVNVVDASLGLTNIRMRLVK